ncbi:phosphoribosyltransferase [Stackebrandtia nassauensis DSM 44728]|uniref:Phosphoribosyltransferase n=1 Tax=Stackebrandtia nassauensis (strain DSM 44728 / CIP 108903 / NRRL B-16338 / NBRC 102104 / LLR-40K-21) TaxID=446470 RepID=D3Q3V0_STANL|nr:VOC family protein [Stackebrandtia nassauensis]ADD44017.1 phosphoribosyltransferase [Stackebrandtia nassauensis DSM 44728]
MNVTIENVAFDCADAYRLASFWSRVTGRPLHADDAPGDPVAVILGDPNWPTLYFQQVPEPKTVKNRVHVCLCPDGPRDTEIERVLALGATMFADLRQPDGSGHVVLTDPEGNEFCLLRSRAELPSGHIRLSVHRTGTATHGSPIVEADASASATAEGPDSATIVADAAAALTSRLTWRGGGTDLWPLLSDPAATDAVARGLAAPFVGRTDVVLGPDPGGVLFGPLVARILGVPFAPVCRDRDFFFQGAHEHVSDGYLYVHRAALPDGARALLVDDWSESGSTVTGVAELVAATGATLSAVSFLVDSLPEAARKTLSDKDIAVASLVAATDLDSGA